MLAREENRIYPSSEADEAFFDSLMASQPVLMPQESTNAEGLGKTRKVPSLS